MSYTNKAEVVVGKIEILKILSMLFSRNGFVNNLQLITAYNNIRKTYKDLFVANKYTYFQLNARK